MKKIILIFFGCISLFFRAQNLVPNGSFETYTNCPAASSQIYYATPWVGKDNNSVDYLNACSSLYSVPYNGTFQYAKDGVAYAGLWILNGINNNYREYAQVQILNSLIVNQYYYLRFFINNAPTKYVTNNIGATITNTAIGVSTGAGSVLNYIPTILKYNNPIISDTLNWIEISGVYKALGGEQYLTIGNFFNDANTDTLSANYGTYQGTYCYLDDVSLINITTPQWQYRDTTIYLGDSVLIGPSITGLNVDWFDMSSTFIKNAPGIYVKPTVTTPYHATETFNSVVYNHTVTVTVLMPVKVDEYEKLQKSISLFPNPTQNDVSITSTNFKIEELQISISDIIGKKYPLIVEEKINSISINLQHLNKGIYFLSLYNEGSLLCTKKLIKE